MTKKSRLNPNKESRSSLKELERKGLLVRRKVGIRHLLRPDGTVEELGHDIGFPWNNSHMPNFYPGVARADRVVVNFKGARAELTATLGRTGYEGHVLDVSTHFPANELATCLLATANSWSWQDAVAYGEAVLVTDNRMHWEFRPYHASTEDVEIFDAMLSTPRRMFKNGDRAWIFFYVEPHQHDIMTFKMRWV
jgi:hypothetical protein